MNSDGLLQVEGDVPEELAQEEEDQDHDAVAQLGGRVVQELQEVLQEEGLQATENILNRYCVYLLSTYILEKYFYTLYFFSHRSDELKNHREEHETQRDQEPCLPEPPDRPGQRGPGPVPAGQLAGGHLLVPEPLHALRVPPGVVLGAEGQNVGRGEAALDTGATLSQCMATPPSANYTFMAFHIILESHPTVR